MVWNGRTFQKRSGGGAVAVVGGVEEVVEPALRLGEALVLAQVDGDGERHVEEQLPVVDRVGAAGVKSRSFFTGVGRAPLSKGSMR